MTIPPGSTIGILGGGQLGKMLAVAAAQLGYRCHVFAPEANPPAVGVGMIAAGDDPQSVIDRADKEMYRVKAA